MEDIINILKKNDNKKLKEFLFKNGKKPKPFSPFYFEKKVLKEGEIKDGNTDNERIDD